MKALLKSNGYKLFYSIESNSIPWIIYWNYSQITEYVTEEAALFKGLGLYSHLYFVIKYVKDICVIFLTHSVNNISNFQVLEKLYWGIDTYLSMICNV